MEEERMSATVQVNDAKVTLEGPKTFVENEIRRLTSLIAAGSATKPPEPAVDAAVSVQDLTERQFIEMKAPKGHLELVTALGFYLTENGQPEFTEDDIRRAYIRANVRPPKVVGQSLRDAKNKKDFIEPGSTRGTYKVSHHGDRFVRFDLPEGN